MRNPESFLEFTDEEKAKLKKIIEARFTERNEFGCWLEPSGSKKGLPSRACFTSSPHRVSYTVYKKPVTMDCVCHLCSNPSCVNPEHLRLGSYLDNARDRARKTGGLRKREETCDPKLFDWPPPAILRNKMKALVEIIPNSNPDALSYEEDPEVYKERLRRRNENISLCFPKKPKGEVK